MTNFVSIARFPHTVLFFGSAHIYILSPLEKFPRIYWKIFEEKYYRKRGGEKGHFSNTQGKYEGRLRIQNRNMYANRASHAIRRQFTIFTGWNVSESIYAITYDVALSMATIVDFMDWVGLQSSVHQLLCNVWGLTYNNYLDCNAPLASLSNCCRDSMDCLGDKMFKDLMYNSYLECYAASGFSRESFQWFDGLFGG